MAGGGSSRKEQQGRDPGPGRILSRRRSARPGILIPVSFLIAAVILTGIVSAESRAADEPSPVTYDVSVRQAYMSWLAAQQEAGMNATIGYITAHNVSAGSLPAILGEFHKTSLGIPASGSLDSLDATLDRFRDLTRQFRDETEARLKDSSLNEGDLAAPVSLAVEGDTRAQLLKDEYWMARMVSEPAAFDRYIRESQATLTALQEYGYDVSIAQQKLDRIGKMRSDFIAALSARNFGAAEVNREKIQDASIDFEESVKTIRGLSDN